MVDWATQTLQPLASQSLGQGTSLAPLAAVPVEALAHAAQAQAVQAASVPVPTVEVRLDCVKAFGLDKDFTFSIHLVLKKGEALTVGRSHQTDAFEKLVPDEDLRSCVSRSHFTISWNGESFSLKRLSVNAMFVDDVMIPQQQEVPLNQGGHIGLCSEANGRSAFCSFAFSQMEIQTLWEKSCQANKVRTCGQQICLTVRFTCSALCQPAEMFHIYQLGSEQ